jgi:hypothetical protein
MYLIFKRVDQRNIGPIQIVGRALEYDIGYIPTTHEDIIPFAHLNATVVSDVIGNAWVFMQAWSGQISVRGDSLQDDRLNVVSSSEEPGTKVKYTATAEELANGLTFFKILMGKMLDEIYDSRFAKTRVTNLESATWTSQREETMAYRADNSAATPVLSQLATARGITLDTMVDLVYTAIQQYDNTIAQLLAAKQAIEGEIKSCQTISDCWVIMHNRFELHMPMPLMISLGVTDGSRLNV